MSKIIAAAALGGLLAWLWTTVRPPVYAATATVLVRSPAPPGGEYDAARADVSRAATLAALSVAPLRLLQAKVDLDIEIPVADLADQVSARNEPGTPLITVTAWAAGAGMATALADELARLLVVNVAPPHDGAAIHLELLEPAEAPSQQAYTRPLRDIATGAFVGAVTSLAFVVARRSRSTRQSHSPSTGNAMSIVVGVSIAVLIIAAIGFGAPKIVLQALTLLAAATAAITVPAGLALLAILLPLPDPGGFIPITLNLLVIGGICYGSLIARIDRRSSVPFGLGTLAVVAFVGLAVIASLPPLNGFEGDRAVDSISRVLQFGSGMLLVLAAADHFAHADSKPYLVLAVLSAVFAGCLGIAELVAGDPTGLPFQGLLAPTDVINAARPSGPFVNANYFGLFMSLGLIGAVGIGLNQPRLRLAMAACVVPLLIAVTLGSLSRGALLATSAGLLALVWLFARRRVALVASVAIVATIALLLPVLVTIRTDGRGTGGRDPAIVHVTESDAGRLNSLTAAIPLFAIDPLFGVGFGQYGFESIRFVGSSPATASHNQYLTVLAEQGLVGVAALIAVVLALIRALRRAWWGGSRIAIAMLATYAVAALFLESFNALQTSGILWIALGAAVAPSPRAVAARRGVLRLLGRNAKFPPEVGGSTETPAEPGRAQ